MDHRDIFCTLCVLGVVLGWLGVFAFIKWYWWFRKGKP